MEPRLKGRKNNLLQIQGELMCGEHNAKFYIMCATKQLMNHKLFLDKCACPHMQ